MGSFDRFIRLGLGKVPTPYHARPTRTRQRHARRRSVFAAHFATDDLACGTAPGGGSIATFECLEVRVMMTASSEADFISSFGQILAYTGLGGDVAIPTTIGGYPVTHIGMNAFYGKTSVTSVALPATVTAIGESAFAGCTGLRSISLPESLTTLGPSAFSGCEWLESITLPSGLQWIPTATFSDCTRLKSVTLPAALVSIDRSAFANCINLSSITLPANLTTIADYAFVSCESLREIAFPENFTSLGRGAFLGCYGLRTVTMGNGITSIEDSTFQACESLTTVTLPGSLVSIGVGAFAGCVSLQSIALPSSLTTIGYRAFRSCSSLTNITFPAGLTTIGDSAFMQCSGLTHVAVPANCTDIGNQAFEYCTRLTTVVLPASVLRVGAGAFSYCASLRQVMFLGDLPSMRPGVFYRSNEATLHYTSQGAGWASVIASRPAVLTVTPSAPRGLGLNPTHRQVAVSWAPPQSDGGLSVSDYVIQYRPSSGSTWTTFDDGVSQSPSAVVTGLDDRFAYVFRVAAVNTLGAGAYSEISTEVLPVTSPGAPINLVAVPGNAQVSLQWAAPSSDGGRPVTDYVIQYSTGNGTNWITHNDGVSTATSTTVPGLRNGVAYTFRVLAQTSVGLSTSPAALSATPQTPPSITRNLGAALRGRRVALNWALPVTNGGAAITDYLVQYSVNNGRTWLTIEDGVSDSRSTILSGLAAGRTYVFRVAARNAAGVGAFSAKSAAIRL
jgi:hypothetical protein